MPNYNYNISELLIENTTQERTFTEKDKSLIDSFIVNAKFVQAQHRVDLAVYTLSDILISSITGYAGYSELLLAAGAGQDGSSALTLDPLRDMKELGYESADVRMLYTFVDNLFSDGQFGGTLFVESISPDRTEFRVLSNQLDDTELLNYTDKLKKRLNEQNHFSEFNLNFGDDVVAIGLNIDTEVTEKGRAVVFKTYEPLPATVEINSTLNVEETVADPKLFEITATIEPDTLKVPLLKGPNFSVGLDKEVSNPTEFLNSEELLSYPITSSNYQLYSILEKNGVDISIRYNTFENFVHFSSAEERLRNFHYKKGLLETYESNLELVKSSSYTDVGITGSLEYWEGLIKGLIANFDHYEKHLYFGSGSHTWPKSSGSLYERNHPTASAWFDEKLSSASNYDVTNADILINTIPVFLREDPNNEPFLMFTHMLGNHFDNIWVYTKAVTDKYDTDHRLDFGISKDIVRSAIQSYGVKMYTGNANQENLFSSLIGEPYDTGSELYITTMSVATSASFNSGSTALEYLQPVAKNDYQHEIQKRIYHNLPYLTKTKGTERGLRALINCFGIPENLLSIRHYGGVKIDSERYFGPEYHATSSISGSILSGSNAPVSYSRLPVESKIRTDNTGSIITGSTLSQFVSIVKEDKKYTDDSPKLQIGFNLAKATNDFIDIKTSGSFNIDNYIGDPRFNLDDKYFKLNKLGRDITSMSYTWEDIFTRWEEANWSWDDHLEYSRDPKAFMRLMNFFDSSLFKMLKDFVPARASVDTGVIVEAHKLARSKVRQVSGSFENLVKTGSVTVALAESSSHGGSFRKNARVKYSSNYDNTIVTPIGRASKNITDEAPFYNGEFSGSIFISTDGEVTSDNPFLKINQPAINFDINFFSLSDPIPTACILQLSGSYLGEYFRVYSTGSDPGLIRLTYPTGSTIPEGQQAVITHDFDTYEFFSLEAVDEAYPDSQFEAWYKRFPTQSADDLITTSSTLSIYYGDEARYGTNLYASFF